MQRLRRILVPLILTLAVPAAAQAAPTWLSPTTLSPVGTDVQQTGVDVAMNRFGDTLAVWLQGSTLQSSFRPAGGSFEPAAAVPFSTGGTAAIAQPTVAFDGATAVVAFTQSTGAGVVVAAAVRRADGTYAETTILSSPGFSASIPRLASNAAGDVVAVWEQFQDTTRQLAVAVRPSGGSFGPVAVYATEGQQGYQAALDAAGNALVVWDAGTAVHGASRPAGGSFGPSFLVATATEDLSSPSVGLGPSGRALVVYLQYDLTASGPNQSFGNQRPWATVRPADGSAFGTPQDISGNDLSAIFTGAAVDLQGAAVAIYQSGTQPWGAVSQPGTTTFEPATRLSPAAHDMYAPRIAAAGDGTTHVLWVGNGADGYHARHVVRPPGGPFAAMQTIPGGPATFHYPRLAVDPQGNAAAIWLRTEGSDDRAQVSGYDAAGPQLRNLTIPPTGTVGSVLGLGVTPVDVWSAVASTGWEFGDGATAPGASVTHAYTAAGSFTPRVSATDSLGNTTSAGGTVAITLPVATPPGTTSGAAPVLTALRLSPTRFRAAASGASVARARVGTVVTYELSAAAQTRFTVQRATTGRRVGGSCRRTTPQNRRRARCTRYVSVRGSFTHAGRKGGSRLTFRGRLARRRLPVGTYRLLARPTDSAGRRGAQRRAAFRIVRR